MPSIRPGEAAPPTAFTLSPDLTRGAHVATYRREPGDPLHRPLRIFSVDPAVSILEGAVALVQVPYEPLAPGPRGRVFHVVDDRAVCDLEDRRVLITQGYAPSTSNLAFHHQMLYAVCSSVYAAFRGALGRDPAWGFARQDRPAGEGGVLRLLPRAFEGANAYYDKARGELCFGYFKARPDSEATMPGEIVYTCLSHAVIAHELTHALLDGLRAQFTVPTRADVLAFHEAFADIVSVLQHFSYREVVLSAISNSRGRLDAGLLTDLARPLAQASGHANALRTAVMTAPGGRPRRYDHAMEPHDLGATLVSAVFEAFNTVYGRKIARYVRLATGGSGELPIGELPRDLQEILANKASQLAAQFLSICMRALDYCPPVDLELGEFLRAVITADRDLVPDDRWAYREAWIDAFRRRGIFPSGVSNLSEDALSWKAPEEALPRVPALSFGRLRFRGDPGRPAGSGEVRRQAAVLGAFVTDPARMHLFGLAPMEAGRVFPACIESIRSSRRIGPDGQVAFDLVAEVTQRRIVKESDSGPSFVFLGGSTIILGPDGDLRYVVGKGLSSSTRLEQQRAFMTTEGQRFWTVSDGMRQPRPEPLRLLHGHVEQA